MLYRCLLALLLLVCLVASAEPSRPAATKKAYYVLEKARATNDANELFVLQVVYPTSASMGIGYLLKFDAEGKRVVRHRLGRGVYPASIQITPDGDLYLAVNFAPRGALRGFRSIRRAKGFTAVVGRLEPDFHFRWVQPLRGGGITASTVDSGTNLTVIGITLDGVSLGGFTASNGAPSSAFRAVINPQGEPQSLWITDQSNASVWETMPGVDRVYITGFLASYTASFGGGSTNLTSTNAGAYVASYSLEGEFQWAVLLADPLVLRFNEIHLRPTSQLGGDLLVEAPFHAKDAPGFFYMVLKSDGTVLLRSVGIGPLLQPPP